jgi:hypothetical protein
MEKKMYRAILALGAAIVFTTAAFACDGQKGNVVFEDNFADDTGGWSFDDYFVSKPPGAFIQDPANNSGGYASSILNNTFTAGQADYCSEMTFPKDTATVDARIGLAFFAKDHSNYTIINAFSDGTIVLNKLVNNSWTRLFTAKVDGVMKMGETDVNSLRVVIKNGLLTAIVNGKKIKSIKMQIPSDNLMFGFYSEYANPSATPVQFPVHSFKVTEGE